eukprot:c22236_g1_i3 orf=80-1714(-)
MELSTPHTDQLLLLGLAVFQNLHKLEYVRSIHMYRKGKYIHTIQEEFVSKKGWPLAKMSAPTHFACLSGGAQYAKAYMDMVRAKQESEDWKCLLDFCTSPPPLARNPHLQTTPSLAPDMMVQGVLTNLSALFTHVSNAHENLAIKWDHPQCIFPSPSACLQGHEQVDQHMSSDTMSQRLQLDLWQQWGTDLELASPRISQTFQLPSLRSHTSDASIPLYGATSSPMSSNNNAESTSWTHTPLAQTSHVLSNVMAEPQSNDEMGRNLTGFAWTLMSPNSQFESIAGESSSNCSMLAGQMSFVQLGHAVNAHVSDMSGCCNLTPFDCGITQPMSSTSNTYSSSDEKSLEAENYEPPDQFKELDWGASNDFRKAKDSISFHKSGGSRAAASRLTELTKDELTHYFNMPITQASKELKVGLTVLKKRCRIFGIPRWPHRKMKSINSLIHTIQVTCDAFGRYAVFDACQRMHNCLLYLSFPGRIIFVLTYANFTSRMSPTSWSSGKFLGSQSKRCGFKSPLDSSGGAPMLLGLFAIVMALALLSKRASA